MLSLTIPFSGPSLPACSEALDIKLQGGTLTLTPLLSDLDQQRIPSLARRASEAIDASSRHIRRLVIDLSEVDSMSSLGLGFCIDARNQANRLGIPTGLFGLNNELRDIIRLMKVERLFEVLYSDNDRSRFAG